MDIVTQKGNVYLLSENGLVYFIDSRRNGNIRDEDLNIRLYINSPNLLYYPKFAFDKNVNADGKNILYIYNHRDLKRYFFEVSLP
ncbi:hypothetical protein NAAC61_08665 [Petrotoga sp. 8T1HF07.NaAc.6.1]|nr:hypothetical protein [Petrotoga sp. 8T1HF07.NaAc.6.1]